MDSSGCYLVKKNELLYHIIVNAVNCWGYAEMKKTTGSAEMDV